MGDEQLRVCILKTDSSRHRFLAGSLQVFGEIDAAIRNWPVWTHYLKVKLDFSITTLFPKGFKTHLALADPFLITFLECERTGKVSSFLRW